MYVGKIFRCRGVWLAPCVCLLSALAIPAHAQFWNKKDYHHWSKKECVKILTDSPWARTYGKSSNEMLTGYQDTRAAAIPYNGNRPANPDEIGTIGRQAQMQISYTAVFFSALPVRQAQVRLGEIESHYDKMSPDQKKVFDQNAARFLSVQFPDDVVIRVTYSSNVDAWRSALDTFWQMQTTAKLQHDSFLSVNRTVDPLRRYQYDGKNGAFFLFFPRLIENEPVLNASQKSLTLQITRSVLTVVNAPGDSTQQIPTPPPTGNITLSFDVHKMLYKGKVAY